MCIRDSNKFFSINGPDYERALLEVIWSPLFAVFSMGLDSNDDQKQIHLCLEGLALSFRLTSLLHMTTQKDAFLFAMTRFTSLDEPKKFAQKNLECIKAVLELSLTQGNHLKNAWKHVIEIMSKLDQLRMIGSGLTGDTEMFTGNKSIGCLLYTSPSPRDS
eukprot:TRINITY_DN8658_c0_g1_i1.p1 TRINITY_DN8658_c0_g1~~TRINITY_DN8658_c0_g1_i1.p1  ORF type:complete len:161 (-),score=23.05 TRINITY_DN8658_c0_g1_i1:37-519(-)